MPFERKSSPAGPFAESRVELMRGTLHQAGFAAAIFFIVRDGSATKADEFSEKFQRGGRVIFNPKIIL